MTYLLQFFHLFSANRKAEVAGRRIAKLLNQNMTAEELRDNYEKQAKDLLEWMAKKQPEMDDKNLPNDLDGLRNEMKKFNEYQNGEKPPRAAEKLGIEGLYSNLQVKLKNSARPEYKAPEGLSPEEIDAKWNNLMKSEAEKEKLLQEELARLEKLNDLLRRFREKLAKLNEFYEDKNKYLEKRPEITSLDSAISEVKLIEGHKQNFENSKSRVADLKKLGDEIIALKYNEPEKIKADTGKIDHNWADLADKGDKKEAWARAEKEKQEQIEKLRLALADKTTELMRWYKDNIESLDDASFPDGLEEVLGFKDNVDKRETDLKGTAETKNAEVADLWKQLADLGVTDNKYTDYNMEDVNKAHGNLGNAIEKYKEAYAAEVKRQEEMEAKRKEFAAAAEDFVNFIAQQKTAVDAVTGEPEPASEGIRGVHQDSAPQKEKLQNLQRINKEATDMGIRHNKHTPHTLHSLEGASADFDQYVSDYIAALEEERKLKHDYEERATRLTTWVKEQDGFLVDVAFDNTLPGVRAKSAEFRSWRTAQKPSHTAERSSVNKLYDTIVALLKNSPHNRPEWTPPAGLEPAAIATQWSSMEEKEKAKNEAIQTEMSRQQKLERLSQNFRLSKTEQEEWTARTEEYLNETVSADTLSKAQIALNMLEVTIKGREANQGNVEEMRKTHDELAADNYSKISEIAADMAKIDESVARIVGLEGQKRAAIEKLISEMQLRNQLGQEFAKLMKEYSQWVDERSDEIVASRFGDSLEEVLAYAEEKKTKDSELQTSDSEKRAAIDAVLAKWAELGMTKTPYTSMVAEDVPRIAALLSEAIAKRTADYEKEVERQKAMEEKRKQFAAAAEDLLKLLAEEKKAVDAISNADPAALSQQIRDAHKDGASLAAALKKCEEIHVECVHLEITENKHTKQNIKSLNFKIAEYSKYIATYLTELKEEQREKEQYAAAATTLTQWLGEQVASLAVVETDNTLNGARKLVASLKKWRDTEKAHQAAEQARLASDFHSIEKELETSSHHRPKYVVEKLMPHDIETLFAALTAAEKTREAALHKELKRQEKLSQEARDFNEKIENLDKWCKEKKEYLVREEAVGSLVAAKIQLDLLATFDNEHKTAKKEIDEVAQLKDSIVGDNYIEKDKILAAFQDVEAQFKELEALAADKKKKLSDQEAKEGSNEDLRLSFAKLAAAFDKHCRAQIAKISRHAFGNNLEEVSAYQATKAANDKEVTAEVDAQKKAIDAVDAKLKEAGATDNVHTLLTVADIEADAKKVADALAARTADYEKELERQKVMEAKRKEFAEAAQNLVKEVDKTQAALEAVKDGEPEERSKKVAELYEKAPIADLLKACDALDAQQRELGISDNKHAPVTCAGAHTKADKLNKFAKNLLATLEQERIVKQRKAERQAETEKKEKIEALRSEFHVKSAQLDAWIDSASEELSSAPQIDLPADVTAAKEKLAEIRKQREQHTPEFTAVIKLAEELEKLQIPDVSSEKCAASWSGIYKQLEERAKHLSEEEPKQLARDKLRHAFADKAKELRTLIEQERAKLESLSGELDAQLKQTEEQNARLSQSLPKEIKELTDLNNQLVAAEVRSNPYTDLTIRAATSLAEQFKELVEERAKLLQGQINEKKGSTVSNEEISEFREIFQQFAKGGTGLKWFEFKAVLSALGEDVDDEQAKKTLDSYDKDGNGFLEFNEFMDYMMKRRSDNDTEDEILEAFREIAGGRDFITEAELAPLVTPQQLAYIKKTMPPKEGVANAFDFAAFTKKSFH